MSLSKAGEFAAEVAAQEKEGLGGEFIMVDAVCGAVFTASAVVRSPGGDRGTCTSCIQAVGASDDSDADAGDWRD